MPREFIPSHHISLTHNADGSLILHNSRTGALGVVPSTDAETARQALLPGSRHVAPLTGVLVDLERGGFILDASLNERSLVQASYVSKYDDSKLQLIILPTEECNFRCVYCYESFLRPMMSVEMQDGIRKYVESQDGLSELAVCWFGGEPLVAHEIVVALTRHFNEWCEATGVQFYCNAVTNAYLLTPEIAPELITSGCRSFQVTLDGVREEHDKRRVLAHGGATFDRIIENLRYLKHMDLDFELNLRHNFDPESLPKFDEFLDFLTENFSDDERFSTDFHPIGQWGGENDDSLTVCEGRNAWQELFRLKRKAVENGFRNYNQLEAIQPNGSVCYASNPRSFVIGSDGKIYKCTVELDYHDRNIVGQLHNDGVMELDWKKMALWVETNGREEGKKCNACYFSPACHGAVCPKEWLDEGDCHCPPDKVMIHETMLLSALESTLPSHRAHYGVDNI